MFNESESLSEPLFITTQVAWQFASPFYEALDKELSQMNFYQKIRELCAPAYSAKRCGRPGFDPTIFVKMYLVGYFENLSPKEKTS